MLQLPTMLSGSSVIRCFINLEHALAHTQARRDCGFILTPKPDLEWRALCPPCGSPLTPVRSSQRQATPFCERLVATAFGARFHQSASKRYTQALPN